MQFINTQSSGRAGAHYSAAVIHGGLVYISGQLSIDPTTGALPKGGVEAHAQQALKNLDEALKAAGCTRQNVLQCRVYTPDVAYWSAINTEYARYFGEHKPARCVVPTGPLHYGCLVEIEAIAALN
jgi:2-iminobutanoate/2-iminopropanoate deaminase